MSKRRRFGAFPAVRAAGVLLLCGTLVGCATGRAPLQLEAGFSERGITNLTLLPIVDARRDKLNHVTVARNVGDATRRLLRSKSYVFDARTEPRLALPRGEGELASLPVAELVRLVPHDAPIALLVSVEDVTVEYEPRGAVYRVRVTAVLIDRQDEVVLWRDRATAEGNFTGMLTMISGGSAQYSAAYAAVRRLFSTLPNAPVGN